MRSDDFLRCSLAAGLALLLSACNTMPPASTVEPAHSTPSSTATTPTLTPAQWQAQLQAMPLPSVLLLGEQHDAAAHQRWQLATVQKLIARKQLAALVLEMAEQGHSTAGLQPSASEATVRKALRWDDKGWPWKAYGPSVMAAVRANIPVVGGNVPRDKMRDVMQQPEWDSHLSPAAWEQQRQAIRSGHCDLLPEAQITPMARVQLAKDALMAHTAQSAIQPGKTVVLIAGRGHVLRSVGIPTWLAPSSSHVIAMAQAGPKAQAEASEHDFVIQTPAVPDKDHCAKLRAQWAPSDPQNP